MKTALIAAPVELPFLLVHGEVVGMVLLGLLIVMSHGVLLGIRRWLASREARKALATSLPHVAPLAAGALVIRGRLHGGTVTTVERGGRTADRTSGTLWLDHHGERIPLHGPVHVEYGTRDRSWWLRLGKRRTAAIGAPSGRFGTTMVRQVKDGDEVLVEGIVRTRVPSDTGYRDQPGSECIPVKDAIRVLATAPRNRPHARGPLFFAVVSLVLLWSWIGVLSIVGERALERASLNDDGPAARLENFDDFTLAAMNSSTRKKALQALQRSLGRAENTEHIFQTRLAIAELRGECPMEFLTWASRFEEALAAARRCGTQADVALHLIYLGRYEEALPLVARERSPHLAAMVAIAAGRWEDAALAAERAATNVSARRDEDEGEGDGEAEAEAVRQIAMYRCSAALYRAYAGAVDPFAELTGMDMSMTCALLRALSLPDAEQVEHLDLLKHSPDRGLRTKAWVFRVAAGGLMVPDAFGELPLGWNAWLNGIGLEEGTLWLAPFAADAHAHSDPISIAAAQLDVAALSIVRGNLAEAQRAAARALQQPDVAKATRGTVPLVLALHDPEAASVPVPTDVYVRTPLEEMASMRAGQLVPTPFNAFGDGCQDRVEPAVVAALAGDGSELADLFEQCQVHRFLRSTPLLGILPRVTTHREELATALRLYRDDMATFRAASLPFGLLESVIEYRDVARFAGDDEDAARWQQLLDRHAAVFADRKRLNALIMWTEW